MPASGSSSELSSHQMAIRSHPGLQKMPPVVFHPSSALTKWLLPEPSVGTETITPPSGMGCFSSWFQVLPYRFLCSFIVLPPLASRSVYYRSCRPENSCEGVPTQAFSAFLRDVSQAPLPITDCRCTTCIADCRPMSVTFRSRLFPLLFRFLLPTRFSLSSPS